MAPAPEFLQDILSEIDAAASARREEELHRRERSHSNKLPHAEDAYLAKEPWQPPLWRTIKADAEAMATLRKGLRPAFCAGGAPLGELSAPGILKPRDLDHWAAERVMQPDRSFKCPKDFKGYHIGPPRGLPEPHEGLLNEQHKGWLAGHYAQRDAHLHQTYNALKRVDKVQASLEESKTALFTSETEEERRSVEMQQAGLRKELAKAKSDPTLVLGPKPYDGVRHLHKWAGAERVGSSFQQRAPWQALTESRELLARGPRRPPLRGPFAGGGAPGATGALASSASAGALQAPQNTWRPSQQGAAGGAPTVPPAATSSRPTTGRPTSVAFGSSRAGCATPAGSRPSVVRQASQQGRHSLAGAGSAVVAGGGHA